MKNRNKLITGIALAGGSLSMLVANIEDGDTIWVPSDYRVQVESNSTWGQIEFGFKEDGSIIWRIP